MKLTRSGSGPSAMRFIVCLVSILAALFGLPSRADAETTVSVQATLTADNFYALYYGTPDGVTFVGRNELDYNGVPSYPSYQYDWSLPETFNFAVKPGAYIYVAAWSDHAVAQGLLGQLQINGQTLLTNTTDWEVAFTGLNLGANMPAPSPGELLAQLAVASWQAVGYSLPHGPGTPWANIQPNGIIPGISLDARWIWGTPLDSAFELTAATEYHIYRYHVPPLTVAIKIKPESDVASINLGSAGVIPVAILSSPTFDATQVVPASVSLAGARVNLVGKAGRYSCAFQDVNSDGRLDLLCHVETAAFFLAPGESTAVLEGETYDGAAIRGQETIRIVP